MTFIAKNFVNLFYPLHCAACKVPLDAADKDRLCRSCKNQIKRNPKQPCAVCGLSAEKARAWSACLYEGALKELIHHFKYGEKLALSDMLAGLMIGFIRDNGEIINDIDLITFVPLYKMGLKKRHFNQSKILAAAIAKEFGRPLSPVLEKTLHTKRQTELSRDGRLSNLAGAFRVKYGNRLDDMRLLLIDDVMTTGATLSECANTLIAGGAAEVRCLTLARGL
ncbi:MAG: ComF family protein [Candidatus Omnitrophota bacterium]